MFFMASLILKKLRKEILKFRLRRGFELHNHISGEYLLTTDMGILYLVGNKGHLLTRFPGYGLVVEGDQIYASIDRVNYLTRQRTGVSVVVRLDKTRLLEGRYFWKTGGIVYRQPFRSSNGRVHGMELEEKSGALLICATDKNAIANASSNGKVTHIFPFKDENGDPVQNDENHINSVVSVHGEIFFVAYQVQSQSMICYLMNGQVFGWKTGSVGFHDLFPTLDGFLTCDTFGSEEMGSVVNQNGFFLANPSEPAGGMAPRGIASTGKETLIGHSHKGPRSKRYYGYGGITAVHQDGTHKFDYLPVAQVYSIRSLSHKHPADKMPKANELRDFLRQRFGSEELVGTFNTQIVRDKSPDFKP